MSDRLRALIRLSLTLGLIVGVWSVSLESSAKTLRTPRIQIAILLDTSNSMDGLINQAKEQLWKVVNEFTLARQKGAHPRIEVALYEYGNDSLNITEGYIRQVLPLTTDLDKVSEKLFALKTNGGSEYCGAVIGHAVANLEWSSHPNDLRVLLIAGNEPFTQGPVNYRASCKMSATRGIIVNTIHCGSRQEGIRGEWDKGALLADGTYTHIDHNKAIAHIDAPQDDEIARLGQEMNKTYVPYGDRGRVGWARQEAQDSNAAKMSRSSMVNRSIFKSKRNYKNTAWDLVDAVLNGEVKLEKIKDSQLPENMRTMSRKEQRAYLDEQAAKRKKIRSKVKKLTRERSEYIARKQKEQAEKTGAETLDSAILKSMRKQAESRHFRFED